MIGLRLLRTTIREEHADLRAGTVRGEQGVRTGARSKKRAKQRAAGFRHHCLAHALGTVPCDGMRDLVTEHDAESGRRLRERKHSGVDGDLASRKAEGVLLFRILDDDEPPRELRLIRHRREPPSRPEL